ncbi:MAG: endonuclease/exonuclease/phosphatase family protein [Planctomycetes bacterium]|nr:endonuclease/exonuclease/phosphatase family protein [Planctomycetota bacterium]
MTSRDPSYAHQRHLHAPLPAGANDFSLLSWNVLADGLAERGGFVRAPQEALSWESRRGSILEQVLSAEHTGVGPDLVCLQEVDRFGDAFEPTLHARGYSGAYVAKADGRDGCCVFWRRARFSLRWTRSLRYLGADGRNGTQVALLAALLDRERDAPLLVATTHLKAKVGNEAEREGQARQLRRAVLAEGGRLGPRAGLIVAGDFNDVPGSLAHAAMLAGGELSSAYAACAGSEPDWTTWKVRADGEVCRTIDYVFCGGPLRPTAVLEPPPRAAIEPERLPSWRYPSDHLSLLVRFAPALA